MLGLMKYLLPSVTDLTRTKSQKNQSNFSCGTYFLEGKATVKSTIQPGETGLVWFQGALWYAKCLSPLTFYSGETVYVSGLLEDGILDNTLRVEPIRFSNYTLSPS